MSDTEVLRDRWRNPSDIFTILMIVGGDVVQRALAQLAGTGITPVSFSFGWVSYAVNMLFAALGDTRLMPLTPDFNCLVINASSMFARSNRAWIIGRLIRDIQSWQDPRVTATAASKLAEYQKAEGGEIQDARIGLKIAFYAASKRAVAGKPTHDWIWWSGFAVALVQLGIAAIPCGLSGDWITLFVTGAGTLLAVLTGSIPQWGEEKWACRRESSKNILITEGNGSTDVVVVFGDGRGLDLEDLAAARSPEGAVMTKLYAAVLTMFWLVLLISVAGTQANTWYLVGVGLIGMVHNVFVSGLPRRPEAFGIHLDYRGVVVERKVMDALCAAEQRYPGLMPGLLPVFFPGPLSDRETLWWDYAARRAKEFKKAKKLNDTALPKALPVLRSADHIPTEPGKWVELSMEEKEAADARARGLL